MIVDQVLPVVERKGGDRMYVITAKRMISRPVVLKGRYGENWVILQG